MESEWIRCDRYIIALLREIDWRLQIYLNNTGEVKYSEYESPFSNTANKYRNEVFEVEAYSWDDEKEQPYNFKCGEIEISWYKWLGRGTMINGEYSKEEIVEMFNRCIGSLEEEEEYEI